VISLECVNCKDLLKSNAELTLKYNQAKQELDKIKAQKQQIKNFFNS
jgi:hypothetical protein